MSDSATKCAFNHIIQILPVILSRAVEGSIISPKMKSAKNIIVSLLAVSSSVFAGEFDTPGPIILGNGSESWSIETKHEANSSKISFTYKSGTNETSGWLPSNAYSDLAPSAVLVNKAPLVVWSSLDNETSDSDVYFSRWEHGGWSAAARVHADNNEPDMVPELSLKTDGQLEVSWWQNTGDEVVQRLARYKDGVFEPQYIRARSAESKVTTSEINTGFYAGMSRFKSDDPLICIAFGDSITQGLKRNYFGQEWSVRWPVHGAQVGSYVEELRARMAGDFKVVRVYNQGVRGERSYHGVDRIRAIMARHSDANCILIMYGANDLYQPRVHHVSTRVNITTMAQLARAAGVVPIIATITPNTEIYGFDVTGKYNDEIRRLAAAGLTLADQHAVMSANWPRYHSGDGLHIGDLGDAVMAKEWARALRTNPLVFPEPIVMSPILLLLLGD